MTKAKESLLKMTVDAKDIFAYVSARFDKVLPIG